MVCKKGFLKNFAKFTRKHLCQSLFFNNFIKKRLWRRCFPVILRKFQEQFVYRTPLDNCLCIMFLHSFKIFFLDRNECESKKSSCQQACINTVGSYYCSCYKGYKLLEDSKRCKGEYLPEFYLEPCQTFTKLLTIFVKFSSLEGSEVANGGVI